MSIFDHKIPQYSDSIDIFNAKYFMHRPSEPQWQARISCECPHCGVSALMESVRIGDVETTYDIGKRKAAVCISYSVRRCPSCHNILFAVSKMEWVNGQSREADREILRVLPESKPKFDKGGIPSLLTDLFEESLSCYGAGYYRASAIMLRRCLEEICNEKGVSGRTLHDKLENLKEEIDISQKLYNMLFELKALGNDAAHVELKSFDKIDKEEVELAIEIFKKIIENLYQHEILTRKFSALKKKKR